MEVRFSSPEPAAFSKARLAAEAAFAPAPQPLQPTSDTVVIVKRKRAIVVESQPESGADIRDAAGDIAAIQDDAQAVRAPRVFRVESSVVAEPVAQIDLAVVVDVTPAYETQSPRAEPAEPPEPAETPKRSRAKRRRTLSSEVTIIRPSADAPTPQPSSNEPPSPREAVRVLTRAPRAASQSGVRLRRTSLPGQYPQLLAKIAALEKHAQKLKRIESAQAVRWIRQAIVEHNLTLRDLGL